MASYTLGLAGYQVYQPRLREQRRRHGRKILATPPLFPGYLFVRVARGWWDARWSPGVIRLIMDGLQPARVSDRIIAEIQSRERNGLVELPKPSGFKPGDQVKILSGPFAGRLGLYAGMKPRERVEVLLSFLGSQQRVTLRRDAVAAPTDADLTSGS